MTNDNGNNDETTPNLIKKRARVILVQRILIGVVALYMLGTSAVATIAALVSLQARNAILDCVEPTGQCYQEGQKRTGEAVQSIVEGTLIGTEEISATTREVIHLTAFCADQPGAQTLTQIEACVVEGLEQEE